MRGILAGAALALWLATGCASPAPSGRAAAITNGTPDSGDPEVVALLQGGQVACTGTLVAPRVVLTAAHCLTGAPPACYFGSAPTADAPTQATLDVHLDPAFDSTTLANDVGLALLADPAPAAAVPALLPVQPLDAAGVGTPLRLVGFGRTAPDDTTPAQKRQGTTQITGLSATELTFGPAPSQTCEGDSGGPAFATLDGAERLVGVTSSGDPACATTARDLRVDAYQAAFIAPYLAATAEGAAQPGDRCFYDANCAVGTCAPALDDPARSFCAPPCEGGCPAGLSCLADAAGARLCRHPTPTPGALGAPCAGAGDCTDGVCAAPAGSTATVCAKTCFPDLPQLCPSGTRCRAVAGSTDSACFADPPAGCALLPGARPGGALLAIALAALLIRSGRRRRARSA